MLAAPMSRVYLAGPIQHVGDYGKGWREWLKQEHPDAHEWVDPLDKYNTMQEAEAEWTIRDIVEDDLRLIESCKAVLAHWEAVPTAGTPMEIFYADRTVEIPVIVQTTLHESDISPWIDYHAEAIVESFDEAIDAVDHFVADRALVE